MAKITLSNEQVALGERVRDALDAARVPIHFLMWYKPEGSEEFELLLETPLFRVLGTRRTYEYFDRLTQALKGADLRLEDVTLILPGSPLAAVISKWVEPGTSEYIGFEGSSAEVSGLTVSLDGLLFLNRPRMGREQVRRQAEEMDSAISRLEHAA